MIQRLIHPAILCGGSGTRLWPLSRKSYPKQFTPLLDARSPFQHCLTRFAGEGFDAPLIVTGGAFRFIVAEQVAAMGVDPLAILLEPDGRNTGPAVLAAALHLAASEPDALMLVAPSDHHIPDASAFTEAVRTGVATAEAGRLVTFGIAPTRPETGYGYLALEAPPGAGPQPLRAFVEKPDEARATAMLTEGRALWNAGVFLARADVIAEAFAAYAADLVGPVTDALAGAKADLGFLRLAADPWCAMRSISFDYAVMEAADAVSVVPYHGAWSDVGTWDAVLAASGPDADGVAVGEGALAIDCRETLLRAEADGVRLVGLGLDRIVAIAMPDAVLVADLARAHDVGAAVTALRDAGAAQAESFPRDHRPWGWFDRLAVGPRFQVKRIVVKPGGILSLQTHLHRAEHWVVVEGTARVTIEGKERLLSENQSVYIPLGSVHRLENPGKVAMVLIEVQTGAYLGEDDITRLEDLYPRE